MLMQFGVRRRWKSGWSCGKVFYLFLLFFFLCALTSCCPWTPQAAYCRTEFTTSGGSSSQSSLRIKTKKQRYHSHLLKVVPGHHAGGPQSYSDNWLITDVNYHVTSGARFVDINSFPSRLLIEIAAKSISYSPEAHVQLATDYYSFYNEADIVCANCFYTDYVSNRALETEPQRDISDRFSEYSSAMPHKVTR